MSYLMLQASHPGVTQDVTAVLQSSAKYRWISSIRKYQQKPHQKMKVLNPIEEKRKCEIWNLMFCVHYPPNGHKNTYENLPRTVLGMQPLQQASSQLKLLHNFKMTRTITPANNLFT